MKNSSLLMNKTTYNQYLQESKLQPKVQVVVYESEADNSAKKSLN